MRLNPPAHKTSSGLITSFGGSPHRSETSISMALLMLPTWDPVAEILMSSRMPEKLLLEHSDIE
jgi:hypothetical protein